MLAGPPTTCCPSLQYYLDSGTLTEEDVTNIINTNPLKVFPAFANVAG